MMKRQLLLALLAAGLAAAPGCADKRDAVPGIRITPSIKTRVTGVISLINSISYVSFIA